MRKAAPNEEEIWPTCTGPEIMECGLELYMGSVRGWGITVSDARASSTLRRSLKLSRSSHDAAGRGAGGASDGASPASTPYRHSEKTMGLARMTR